MRVISLGPRGHSHFFFVEKDQKMCPPMWACPGPQATQAAGIPPNGRVCTFLALCLQAEGVHIGRNYYYHSPREAHYVCQGPGHGVSIGVEGRGNLPGHTWVNLGWQQYHSTICFIFIFLYKYIGWWHVIITALTCVQAHVSCHIDPCYYGELKTKKTKNQCIHSSS